MSSDPYLSHHTHPMSFQMFSLFQQPMPLLQVIIGNIDDYSYVFGIANPHVFNPITSGTGKLESSHPWNSADSAVVLEASLALK